MKRNLGGDRLGSGNKMMVDIQEFGRSTFDNGYLWRSTMAAGTLVPFMSELAKPGDTWDINLDIDVKTHPTIGPLFGSFKVQADVFIAPIRLYNGKLHYNPLKFKAEEIFLPVIPQYPVLTGDDWPYNIPGQTEPVTNLDNIQINPSCLLAYLGIRGVGIANAASEEPVRYFNAVPILAYWEIFLNYYANKQEENAYVINTPLSVETDPYTVGNWVVKPTAYLAAENLGPVTAQADKPTIQKTGYITIVIPAGTYDNAVSNMWRYIIRTGDGRDLPLSDISAGTVAIDATHFRVYYNWNKYGDMDLLYWRHLDALFETPTLPTELEAFALTEITDMRDLILQDTGAANAFDIYNDGTGGQPYSNLVEFAGVDMTHEIPLTRGSQQGLAVKTYQSDLFNNWINTEWIDEINLATAVDTTGNTFTMDQLLLAEKMYKMMNAIAASGGTYKDYIEVSYSTEMFHMVETPIYMGSLIKELVFQEVVSNSAASSQDQQPLGTLAGKGVMAKKHKGGKIVIKVKEPSYIIGIISLTPRVDYSQGNKWDMNLQTLADIHTPWMDQIGYQDLIVDQMHWASTIQVAADGPWITQSAGKQPAWTNYTTNVNRTYGNFAIENNEMFMTNNRRYEPDVDGAVGAMKDITTYIDPIKFNNIFAETARDAQNFWVQMSVDATSRRVQSSKLMPTL